MVFVPEKCRRMRSCYKDMYYGSEMKYMEPYSLYDSMTLCAASCHVSLYLLKLDSIVRYRRLKFKDVQNTVNILSIYNSNFHKVNKKDLIMVNIYTVSDF